MVLAIDEDRAHHQLRRLERAERPLDVRQALVGLDRLGSNGTELGKTKSGFSEDPSIR